MNVHSNKDTTILFAWWKVNTGANDRNKFQNKNNRIEDFTKIEQGKSGAIPDRTPEKRILKIRWKRSF